jgi:predicted MFS family arabinose efflux permease
MEHHPELSRTRLGVILLTLWLMLFTQSSQFLVVAPILPRIHEQLGVPDALLGTLVSGYAVAVAVMAILAGPISDTIGRRTILRVGSVGMAVALLGHTLATDYASLLAARVAAGATSGVLAGAAIAYVGDLLPYNRRGSAMGVLMSAMAFGQILGIPIGAMLASRWGFQSAFVSFGVVMVVASALTFLVLPQVRLGGGPVRLSNTLRAYVPMLSRPEIVVVNLASLLMMFSVSMYIVYQPAWLEATFEAATPDAVASVFLVGGLTNAVVGPIAGWLSDRIGRKALVVGSAVPLAFLMMVTPQIPSFGWAYVLFIAVMAMVALRISPYNAMLTGLVGPAERGSLLSLTVATGQTGFAVGAAVAGAIYASSGYAGTAFVAGLGALGVGLMIGLFVPEPDPDAEDTDP